MRKQNLMIGVALLAALAAGFAVAQQQLIQPSQMGIAALEWEMFSENVATGDPQSTVWGDSFLYNKRTGKVFRHTYDCGDTVAKFANGCLSPIPASSGADGWDNTNNNPDGSWTDLPAPTGIPRRDSRK